MIFTHLNFNIHSWNSKFCSSFNFIGKHTHLSKSEYWHQIQIGYLLLQFFIKHITASVGMCYIIKSNMSYRWAILILRLMFPVCSQLTIPFSPFCVCASVYICLHKYTYIHTQTCLHIHIYTHEKIGRFTHYILL